MKFIYLAALLILISFEVLPQEKDVKGMITTFGEIPVVNVTILVKSTGMTYYSDSVGSFTVRCSVTDKLKLSAEGFTNQTVNVKKETMFAIVNMDLLPKQEAKDVAIGYGHVKDKDKLYAMAGMTESGSNFSRYKNIYEILETSFAGVQVINGEVIIRNANSFDGTKPALLIVDGREVSATQLAAINTGDIAQVNILKDSSASVYGVRGANGVVVVETKRGK
jgi:TonB-dependent SusC/RagA subfamily outer membrane receptor